MDTSPVLKFVRLRPEVTSDIPLPRYMTPQSAGMDIYAAVETDLVLNPGDIRLVPSGLAVALPVGFEAQIRPRSGLAVRYGIGIINSPGTIDADYRGEIMIPLINFGKTEFVIHHGNRIAQMVIQKVYQVKLHPVEVLDETERNTGGFGHTGI
ncbi:MAG: dUTP diphosphatase [Desulfobacterales bacterium]|nr:dUTP diphosphatase [Desulfobacterales bacterium]MDD4071453.1 dUTP diphosphatase [Desulfobacterales bacterium]MDD4393215.1 dUTP diphosphatase [Desulfobacterales bacterium]